MGMITTSEYQLRHSHWKFYVIQRLSQMSLGPASRCAQHGAKFNCFRLNLEARWFWSPYLAHFCLTRWLKKLSMFGRKQLVPDPQSTIWSVETRPIRKSAAQISWFLTSFWSNHLKANMVWTISMCTNFCRLILNTRIHQFYFFLIWAVIHKSETN